MLVIIMAQLRKHFPNCENIFSENYKQYASTGQYYGPAFMPKTRKKESRSNEHWKLFVILEKSVQGWIVEMTLCYFYVTVVSNSTS